MPPLITVAALMPDAAADYCRRPPVAVAVSDAETRGWALPRDYFPG